MRLFDLCFDWVPDGGNWEVVKGKQRRVTKTGYYKFVQWPRAGTFMNQPNKFVEFMEIIKSEHDKITSEKLR